MHQQGPDAAAAIVGLTAILVLIVAVVFVGWVLPIVLGVRAANRKQYSPHWMWFGIHPLFGWIACIVLLCLPPRIQCPNCGGFVAVNFRICPYCHAGLDLQPNRCCRPTPPSPSP
jgi:hypothetical protein